MRLVDNEQSQSDPIPTIYISSQVLGVRTEENKFKNLFPTESQWWFLSDKTV